MGWIQGTKPTKEHRAKVSASLVGNKRAEGKIRNPLKHLDPEAYKMLCYAWTNMKTRCTNKNVDDYKNYGGRGIRVDPNWVSFAGFVEDMYESLPKENRHLYTLERIDVNGDYTKDNCRWATRKEQSRNTRRNKLISFQGTKKTLTEWAEYMGIKSSTARQRYYVYGWDIEKTLLTPVQERRNFGLK